MIVDIIVHLEYLTELQGTVNIFFYKNEDQVGHIKDKTFGACIMLHKLVSNFQSIVFMKNC